ncbi:hypothetical protein [Deinococcus hopiensis]|uniref:Lipoprotein n=1 Tax=Deinococcus hopiensis KR-140 TaxID=695939 RepID=A0A1W1VBY7_9DEIO|nr:hypothetical protein [Deinococcus hopiensis]SMB90862.1 hypothetical protein SAMN00790413_00916 [Deinococcus hopiensis KR-140]
MRKTFHLPLLAALPALLASCAHDDYSRYSRVSYNSYEDCRRAYAAQIAQGLRNPCYRSSSGSSFFYYGPYFYSSGSTTRYLGYTPSGGIDERGMSYDARKGAYGSFKARGVSISRGGLTSSGRSRGSFGG